MPNINVDFYKLMNNLYNGAVSGALSIIDYDSFVDAGKLLADMSADDLKNGFLTPLMNKVKLSLNTYREYEGGLDDMLKGNSDFGTVEMFLHDFYTARYSPFVSLPNTYDDENMNPFLIVKPKLEARYYTNTNPWEYALTIQETDLRGAFTSPSKMANLIETWTGDINNSNTFNKELNRLGLLAKALNSTLNTTRDATSIYTPSVKYNLLKLYNETYGETLTVTNCLTNAKFVAFCAEAIRAVSELMRKPSMDFNVAGDITTFTPSKSQRLKISAQLDSAIRISVINAYNKEYGMITQDYEVLPYWQDSKNPLTILADNSAGAQRSEKILAFLYDDYALSEFIDYENTTNAYNARCEYFTYYWHMVRRYCYLGSANTVTFYIAE